MLSDPSPDTLKQLGRFDKAPEYAGFDIEGHSTLFSARDKRSHAPRAARVAAMFSRTEVRRKDGMLSRNVKETCALMETILRENGSEVEANLLGLFRAFAVETAAMFCLDRPYGALQELRASPSKVSFEAPSIGVVNDIFNSVVPVALFDPRAVAWWEWASARIQSGRELLWETDPEAAQQKEREDQAMSRFGGLVDGVVDEAFAIRGSDGTEKEEEEERDKLRSYAARLLGDKGEEGPSRTALVAEVSDLLFAGTESLASTLSLTLYHLFQPSNEVHLRKLRSSLPTPSEHPQTVELRTVEDNIYLNATAREGLRLACPVPRPLNRIVPASGWTLEGVPIPPGTIVGVGQHSLHRSATGFPDSEHFLPARWIQANDGGGGEKSPLTLRTYPQFIAFGLPGVPSRACVGQNLAMAELVLMLAEFVRRFDLVLPSDAKSPEGRDLWNKGFDEGKIVARVKTVEDHGFGAA